MFRPTAIGADEGSGWFIRQENCRITFVPVGFDPSIRLEGVKNDDVKRVQKGIDTLILPSDSFIAETFAKRRMCTANAKIASFNTPT